MEARRIAVLPARVAATLDRHARGECEVIPIVVRACRYDKLELGKIQAIRPDDKSIDEHDKRDPAWEQVTREIDRVIAPDQEAVMNAVGVTARRGGRSAA